LVIDGSNCSMGGGSPLMKRSGFERANYKLVGFVPAEKFTEHVTSLAAL